MRPASICAGLAIGAIHAAAVVALLAAVEPAWRPATGERAPLGVWLIPMPPVAWEREPDGLHGVAGDAPCARVYEIDDRGHLFVIGPPSRAFLRSLPAGSDGRLPRVGIPCPAPPRPPTPAWSKQAARPPADEIRPEPEVLTDIVVL